VTAGRQTGVLGNVFLLFLKEEKTIEKRLVPSVIVIRIWKEESI
jgi:hypothetical protein